VTGFLLVGAVRCVRAARQPPPGQPELWWYLPTGVVPERTAGGRAGLLLVHTGQTAFLQLGACLGPEAGAVDSLPAPLAQALGREVSLGPAPVAVEAAELRLRGPGVAPRVLARSETSRVFPYTAVFRVSLDPAGAELAAAATGGRAGLLTVRFTGIRWQPGAAALTTSTSRRLSTTFSRTTTEGGTTVHRGTGGAAATAVTAAVLPALEPTAGGDVADWVAGDAGPPTAAS
jgi:hypothetical protein